MVIGIIGKIGSGKGTCIEYIKELCNDIIVYSCDDIAKEMIENKEVDYEMGDPVEFFTNENLQEQCRNVVHKSVFSRICKNINNLKTKRLNVIIECALPSLMLYDLCDKVICIESSFEDIKKRLAENRNYTEFKSSLIYDSQKYYEKFYDMADYHIVNNGSINKFKKDIEEVISEICFIRK